MAGKSRADYFKERRADKKNLSVYIDKYKIERLEEILENENLTKKQWLERYIEEEIGMDFNRNIECPYCGNITTINLRDYIQDETPYEREMGTETEYTIECDDIKCIKCSKNFSIHGSIWEYPYGALNSENIRVVSDEDIEE